jgi:hypothetical protein
VRLHTYEKSATMAASYWLARRQRSESDTANSGSVGSDSMHHRAGEIFTRLERSGVNMYEGRKDAREGKQKALLTAYAHILRMSYLAAQPHQLNIELPSPCRVEKITECTDRTMIKVKLKGKELSG